MHILVPREYKVKYRFSLFGIYLSAGINAGYLTFNLRLETKVHNYYTVIPSYNNHHLDQYIILHSNYLWTL